MLWWSNKDENKTERFQTQMLPIETLKILRKAGNAKQREKVRGEWT